MYEVLSTIVCVVGLLISNRCSFHNFRVPLLPLASISDQNEYLVTAIDTLPDHLHLAILRLLELALQHLGLKSDRHGMLILRKGLRTSLHLDAPDYEANAEAQTAQEHHTCSHVGESALKCHIRLTLAPEALIHALATRVAWHPITPTHVFVQTRGAPFQKSQVHVLF